MVTLLYCTPGNVGLALLWRRKASHQHWRDVYCCSRGLISKLSLCSLHTDCPMCCVSWTSATRVQSSCSLCTQTEHVTMIQVILLRERKKRKGISIKVVSKIWLQLLWSGNRQDRWWRTGLHFLLADVAYEIFTGEIVPQRLVGETRAVFSFFMAVAPVVGLTWLPFPAGEQQRAITC